MLTVLKYVISYLVIGFIVDCIYIKIEPKNSDIEKRIFHIIFWPFLIFYGIFTVLFESAMTNKTYAHSM